MAPSLILVVNPAVQYALYERLVSSSLRLKERRALAAGGGAALAARAGRTAAAAPVKLGAGEVFLLGALAKVGATIVTYPMIVVKSRLQAENTHTDERDR